ncbi:hypothetical protein HQ393_05315 [Chitinibacter bivalviorum]|uniref:Energy-coupling factor transporter transmembrane protein EcfT n=1 Tax=Chitinibacter bivalviorum TaxID=2739434 RepID=A0A7H9BGQ2_9NEIS|nr:hypothetical protein [Chitinibacter bivalviorum]QLG87719.1 hypothetical protein HQ393_05315 [Chitinibacter bivalviorum]
MKIHAAHLLALWLWLLSFLPWLERFALFVFGFVVVVLSVLIARARLIRCLPRMRWLFLAMVVIYAWTTPGVYLSPYWFSPTVEGVRLGFEQGMRLLVVASSLQILLTFLDKDDIVSALYCCAKPLSWLGVDIERCAARLALTLIDAEMLLEQRKSFYELLQGLMDAGLDSVQGEILILDGMSQWQKIILNVQFLLIVLTVCIGNSALWK